jgi:hypothetical protein
MMWRTRLKTYPPITSSTVVWNLNRGRHWRRTDTQPCALQADGLVKAPHRTAARCVVAREHARRGRFSEIRFCLINRVYTVNSCAPHNIIVLKYELTLDFKMDT